jgi:hypothetical protein
LSYRHKDEEINVYSKGDKIIKKDVSIVAKIKVKPIICIDEKDIEVKCIGHLRLSNCKKYHIEDKCEFCIKQDLTLRIPVRFDAETEVKDKGIVCHPEEHCHDYDEDDDEK